MTTSRYNGPSAKALLSMSALIALVLLAACAGKPAPTSVPAAQPAATAAQPSTAAVQPTSAVTPASPTTVNPTPTTAARLSPTAATAPGKFADPSELSSYRMKLTTWETGADKSTGSVILREWVKNPPASRIVMGAIEMITVGGVSWTKIGDRWVQQASTQQQESGVSDELMRQLETKSSYQDKGRETINGISCRHYAYSGEVTISSMGNLKGQGTARGQGNVWVADQSGLPAVVIRSIGTAEVKMKVAVEAGAAARDVSLAMSSEMELYDINQPITIKAPEGAILIPGGSRTPGPTTQVTRTAGPTAQATQPRPSATPAATAKPTQPASSPQPTTAAGQTIFSDDFSGPALDARWGWEDPAGDASFDLQAVTGSLRLTAMAGNDLAPWTNYDAPRLLTQVSGDFVLETRVRFDPQVNYQGAGLLVWLDDENFLRLEHCFGGLSGDKAGIAFLKQEWGSLDLAADPVSASAQLVELRLQRQGEVWTAWWRDPTAAGGGTWQQIGSTELSAGSDVLAGIVLVVDWGAAEISADFDFVRILRAK